MKNINVGIIGAGTVGGGVIEILRKHKNLPVPIRIKAVADRNLRRLRRMGLERAVLTDNAWDIVNSPDIDIVVELIGGCGAAKNIVTNAIKKGKAVVTANKALLAEYGRQIFAYAEKHGGDIYYEAGVAGSIPVIKIFREAMAADRITSILGIVNGTSNYVLTKMQEEGVEFAKALAEAKKGGYAERRSTFDIEGIDSAHKLVIMSSLALGSWVKLSKVYTEGIRRITHPDILYASELGYVIKLLAVCKDMGREIEVRVHPTLLPKGHVLANVNGVYNAVFIKADNVGSQLFYGKGAGRLPAGSAVAADIIDVARNLSFGIRHRIPAIRYKRISKKIRPMDRVVSQCYLRFTVIDKPGVLAKIAGILGRHKISIASVIQKYRHKRSAVPVVIMTHAATEKNIKKALFVTDKLPEVKAKTMMIRVEK